MNDVERIRLGLSRSALAFVAGLGLIANAFAAQVPPSEAPSIDADSQAFVELASDRDSYFVGEPLKVHVRFGFDATFFGKNAIQLFRRPLDVPIQLRASWLASLDGARFIDGAAASVRRDGRPLLTFALDEDVASAEQLDDRMVDGRAFTVLEIVRDVLPEQSGELAFSEPELHFAYATRFADDFVNGRTALDRRDATVRGKALRVRIEPLPDAGRPHEFSGAVGRFAATASASPRQLAANESLKLALSIRGDGNLAFFDAPRLDGLEGLHLLGQVDDHGRETRTITYDLAPRDAKVDAIPAFDFAYFDPTPPGVYRRVHLDSIAISVRPAEVAHDAPPAAPSESKATNDPSVIVVSSLAVALAIVFVALRVRSRRANSVAAFDTEVALEFGRRANEPDSDLAELFANYLSARLACTPSSIVDHRLEKRLVAANVRPELARRTAELVENLIGARFGGRAHDDAAKRALELVDELEAEFRRARVSRRA